MFKKVTIITLLSVALILGGASMALAAGFGPGQGLGEGINLCDQDLAPEEILEARLARIDAMVENGSITAEEAISIKTSITERAENCVTPGEGNPEERLNIGFGRSQGLGNMDGAGNGQRIQAKAI